MNPGEESSQKKRILILAPFFRGPGAWISDFCHRPDLDFRKAPYFPVQISWHQRGSATPIVEWVRHLKYAHHALKWNADCVVTCFPQLALVTAVLLQLQRKRETRLIAWNFNVGSLRSRWKGYLAGRLLKRVDRFVVHSRTEIGNYARWLGVDEKKICFVPLQKGSIDAAKTSPIETPYIVSMGSANRDYRTLVDAVAGTGIKTVIITKKAIVDVLPDHPEIVKLHSLTVDECNSILGCSELNVTPLASNQTASGQVAFTTSMRLGIPIIATRCVGTIDYIRNGENGFLVPAGDPAALREAIELLWMDKPLRSRIGSAGRDYAEEHLSDEAAGRNFAQVIDEVFAES